MGGDLKVAIGACMQGVLSIGISVALDALQTINIL
ncbi:hypothetical protein YPC_0521 [Yersinia pestis biovar Medievalis str. Harbin 35]|nr:hypothetical protein YPC_0521 [Yersinia pestis biovar Medievalis str. Harbin 35]EEO78485.1 hypothetical protein YP516_0212 [Yersinia pestis Nepal516]EEO79037.1 hypothetical protein YPF_4481 [Yersinia pestis biovar Orientalis str. India 195]EEO85827.1 hypothetical protein YPH_1703 [Yersinia pestis biovar Orientalis str. PEXU2]EEO91178.1 hypothetical protein YPS_1398 [Yersinia pestis Pestoides A]